MRAFLGLLSALAGAAAGAAIGALLAAAFAKATNASNREGAIGYFVVAAALLGALGGIAVGILLYARSAPPGEGLRTAGTSLAALAGLAGLVALFVWARVSLREDPVTYGNTQANLLLEFRLRKTDAPGGSPSGWLDVEVQTSSTRPAGTVISSDVREEGDFLVVPVVQNPLMRSSNRVIVARVRGLHDEVFVPPIRRKPDPKAGWSDWYSPRLVEPAGSRPILEVRFRISLYGE